MKNLIFDLKNPIFDLNTGLTYTRVNMINVFQKKKKKKTNHNFEHFPAGENGVRALASS